VHTSNFGILLELSLARAGSRLRHLLGFDILLEEEKEVAKRRLGVYKIPSRLE
jgi:hypothetical protein